MIILFSPMLPRGLPEMPASANAPPFLVGGNTPVQWHICHLALRAFKPYSRCSTKSLSLALCSEGEK
jgi:hypothetical protein